MDEIDISNKFFVGVVGDDLNVILPIVGRISRDEALSLAAWIVALADPGGERFARFHTAVCST